MASVPAYSIPSECSGTASPDSELLWTLHPEVFLDLTQDLHTLKVRSWISPLEYWQPGKGRQKESKPCLSNMAMSLDHPAESRRNGLTCTKESY